MAADYRLDVYNTSGVIQYTITDFTSLAYTKRVNAPGLVQFGLAGDHNLVSDLGDKWQIEVWRRPEDSSWGREITGLYRYGKWTYGDQGSIFNAICPGLMSMLSWRVVAWYAGVSDRSQFTSEKAETIMKTMVTYNAASSATTGNGRIRDGAITGLTVESDGANGNTLDYYCSFQNLLESLQGLAKIAGGDFDLVKTSATAWQFRWYTGQLGTDRTATIIFGLGRGNVRSFEYEDNKTQEKTVVLVGGKGEGSDREVVTRTGSNYNASTNNIETFINAVDVDTTAGLEDRGDEQLDDFEAKNEFIFKTMESPATLYGVDYVLGDKVTAVDPISGSSLTLKVDAVNVSFDRDGVEIINPEFIEV